MSEFLPPAATWSGQAAVFYRLLEGVDPDAYCLLSRVDFDTVDYRGAPRRLPATYHHLGGAVTSSPEQARGLERWAIRTEAHSNIHTLLPSLSWPHAVEPPVERIG